MAANGRKAIFITGAASGMGRETARLFHGKGWFVGGFDIDQPGLEQLRDELGAENCRVQRLDVTDRDAYRAALQGFAADTQGKLDILFNNAGIARGGPFAEQAFEEILAVVNVNLIGVLIGIYEALPLLKATRGSMCFTTSSSSATFGLPRVAVYSATKHAVRGLSESLAVEFRAYGIKVADVLPGIIDTALLSPSLAKAAPQQGMFRVIPAIEVAKVVWEAYHSDKLHWYVPPELADLDKAATLTPEAVRDKLEKGFLNFDQGDVSAG